MSIAFVFPGQGSQAIGMLAGLAAAESVVRETFSAASDALGQDLWQLCQDGPEDDLNATENTQPALLTASVALLRLWRQRGGAEPVAVAGHSLGEFSALVAADALDFEAAVNLVRLRGACMQTASPLGAGAMAVILGLDDDAVRSACEQVSTADEVVVAANLNAPGQVVIAGHAAAVDRAGAACRDAGARRALPLNVSVPSHSPLMASAASAFRPALERADLRTPAVPVYQNVNAEPATDVHTIRTNLLRQLCEPVLWSQTLARLCSDSVTTFVECGPGRVLSGLVKRIDRAAVALPLDGPDQFAAALEATQS